jgi:CheY-like chemotaxis protein
MSAVRGGSDQSTDNGVGTVLVVEDNLANAFALKVVLERMNMAVVEAHNGVAALAALETRPEIGIVLMDIMMPVMDGYAAMTAIRDRPHLMSLPIIALTANHARGERGRCLAAGASEFMQKPIDVPELLQAIDTWMTPRGNG